MALEVPAPRADAGEATGAPAPGAEVADEQVGDASAYAEPALRGDVATRTKITREVSANVSLGRRLGEIWRSRELLIYLVRTEIKVKYKNSFLGLIWSMIAPAMTLAIFYMVFTFIAKNGIPHFVIFLFAGLLIWNLFQVGLATGTGVVVNNSGLVKKVSFPREILALAAIGSASVYFFFQAVVMVIFLVAFQFSPAWTFLPLLPLALVAAVIFAAAMAVLLSAINVYLRDTQHLVEVVLTAWFWLCPIVYSFQATLAPKLATHHLTWLYLLNPMTPLVLTFQRVIYGHTYVTNTVSHAPMHILPSWSFWTYAGLDLGVLVGSLALFFVALVVFGRLEGNFAEEL